MELDINDCSKIGFGGYRISVNNKEHRDAFRSAISLGCNLADTASNYTYGQSEKLIGQFVLENPNQPLFIVSKGGYIQGDVIQQAQKLNNYKKLDNYVKFNENFHYCISKDFLETQIHQSCNRLSRNFIDGYLLHNPEYLYRCHAKNPDLIYQQLKESFEFLEDKVSKGVIKYYGISSNTLALSEATSLDIFKLINLANEVSCSNHFKLIQIPYNLYECEAKKRQFRGKSLIDIAHDANIKILGNRPLNAKNERGPILLAKYEKEIAELNDKCDHKVFQDLIDLIEGEFCSEKLQFILEEYPILHHLQSNWMQIGNPEAVGVLLNDHLFPLLNAIFGDPVPRNVLLKFQELFKLATLYSKKGITDQALKVEKELMVRGVIDDSSKPLTLKLVESYLEDGVDHILVGCRRKEYVDQMF